MLKPGDEINLHDIIKASKSIINLLEISDNIEYLNISIFERNLLKEKHIGK